MDPASLRTLAGTEWGLGLPVPEWPEPFPVSLTLPKALIYEFLRPHNTGTRQTL